MDYCYTQVCKTFATHVRSVCVLTVANSIQVYNKCLIGGRVGGDAHIYTTYLQLLTNKLQTKFSRKLNKGIRHLGSYAHHAPRAAGLDGFVRKYVTT